MERVTFAQDQVARGRYTLTDAPPDLKIEQLRAEDIPAVLDTFAVWHKTREQSQEFGKKVNAKIR
jgi:hypothetical protein